MMTPRRITLATDVVTGIVVASVGVAAAGLSWRLYEVARARPVAAVPAAAPPRAPVDLAPILVLAPFGRASAVAAQQTSLPLSLRGVILATPASASTAMIAVGGEPPRSFGVGQPVGGAIIDSIASGRVSLNVGGRLEYLAFPRAGAPAPAAAPPPPVAPAPPPEPRKMLEGLGATPVAGGYSIGPSPPASVRGAGLLPGDVIEQVNGTPLGDPQRDRQLLSPATLAAGARITVLRNGKRTTLSLPSR